MTSWDDLLRPGAATDFFQPPFPPRGDSPGFDPGTAWWLAELSRLVYRHDVEEETTPPFPTRTEFLSRAGLRQESFWADSGSGTQAFLVRSTTEPALRALVFRGTEGLRDWLTNIRLPPVPAVAGPGRVHHGFQSALNSVWPGITERLGSGDRSLLLAGHSLGGALATLAAARIESAGVYTFGAPAVGDGDFLGQLARVPWFRVTHAEDPVPDAIPSALGYAHGGRHKSLPRFVSPTTGGLRRLLDWFRRAPEPLADHAPVLYVRALRQLA